MATINANPIEIIQGGTVKLTADPKDGQNYQWHVDSGNIFTTKEKPYEADWNTSDTPLGGHTIKVTLDSKSGPGDEGSVDVVVLPQQYDVKAKMKSLQTGADGGSPAKIEATVRMERASTGEDARQALWVAIRNRTEAINFEHYSDFIKNVLCDRTDTSSSISAKKDELAARMTLHGPDSYDLLKLATEVFLLTQSGVVIEEVGDESRFLKEESKRLGRDVILDLIKEDLESYLKVNTRILPFLNKFVEAYLNYIEEEELEDLAYCKSALNHRLTRPSMLELIWSYWHEEGMLVQTMNAITMRFQNRRSSARDPLAQLEIDPLRPLNHLLWGFIQEEQNRLSVPRRAYEYDHHYGLTLLGKAVPRLRSADSRSKFIVSFHNLLYRAAIFYREDSDTTVVADAFPLLNAIREVHLILAEGAHNQFGDLPWTARAEMLIMQWLLARPEMREFLRGRHMVPYHESWMGAVDAMKKLQGWTDIGITHFNELAVTGERILLSLRYGDWMNADLSEDAAKAWVRYFKPEIQRNIHALQVLTDVDHAAEISDSRDVAARYLMPSIHLQRRLSAQTAGRKPLSPIRSAGRQSNAELEYHYRRAGML